MTKNILTLSVALCAILFSSCSTQETYDSPSEKEKVPMTFTAIQEGSDSVSSRTAISPVSVDTYNVVWSSEDKIAVLDDKSGINEFTLSSGANTKSGTFNGSTTQESTKYCGVYPSSAVNTTDDYKSAVTFGDGSITLTNITIPTVQTATANTYDPAAAVMTSYTTGSSMQFYHVCTFAKVTTTVACKVIEFYCGSDDKISGSFDITLSSSGEYQSATANETAANTKNYVKLVPKSGETSIAAGTYYIALLPNTTIHGLEITLDDQDNSCYRTAISHSESTDFTRKNIVDLTGASFFKHSYVNLNGTKWAKTNIGFTTATGVGRYFAWGETTGYSSSSDAHFSNFKDYKFIPDENRSESSPENYISKYKSGDNKTTLESEDDAATYNWGHHWRTPTSAELKGLNSLSKTYNSTDNCITYTKDPYSISIPLFSNKIEGIYWTNTLYTTLFSKAYYVKFSIQEDDKSVQTPCDDYEYRCKGYLIRPIVTE